MNIDLSGFMVVISALVGNVKCIHVSLLVDLAALCGGLEDA